MKEKLKIIGKFCLWSILFVVLFFVGILLFYDEYTSQIHIGFVIFAYFYEIYSIFIFKKDMAYWKECELQDTYNGEFYKRFNSQYRGFGILCIFLYLAIFIPLKYVSLIQYIAILFLISVYDTWNRRYITNDIKHDLILEKLYNKNYYN